MESATAEPSPTTTGALTAFAFMAPWIIFSIALPAQWRWRSLVLLGLLLLLLVLAAFVAGRLARARHADGPLWAFLTVITLGFALVGLMFGDGTAPRAQFLCRDCARVGDLGEAFCYGCGS